ncbi:glycoside hydrolase family 3 protein [Alterisphingorhabdus coralli]|uniref:Glycoside hydrolase family 3 N-terminal domain-containing protein n=1 Tax=Alterisphingorhabdus coralli TaxID=3071408 RepID=A0AA97F7U4_9SPHN|nr:glycoside hydrolase family 3 N-terminal domain-containing protein [Parasphingorhabdus sp. SCSIO 66989]WOE75526.1 glycoside hydrolase family 3 N-terminal domain-containing protein [Parasphingorhabdus sp. SCSIO 66989]
MVRNILAALSILMLTSCSMMSDPVTDRASEILAQMTMEEKVGQIIQADISAVTPEDVRKYHLGSVLNGGNSAPGGGKVADAREWLALADAFWEASTDKGDGRVGIPLIWGTDAVHGHNNLQSAVIFPHNIGLGAANDPDLIGRIAEVTAREVRATGQEWTFAPTLAVARDDRWGRTYESYSEAPDIVAAYAGSMVQGLQGQSGAEDFLTSDHVIATAKHFVGDGGTEQGIDKGDTQGDLEEILTLHGAGYGPAISADVQTVMASFSSINGTKMHGYKALLTDRLKGEMGFDGFVVGDWNGHAEIPGCTAGDCDAALHAGLDMYMAPDSWRELYDNLLDAAKNGDLDLDRLDDAVMRILKVKLRAGLFDAPKPSERASSNASLLGSDAHREVAREAVRKSLVLLKNNSSLLPLQSGQTVLIAGSGADSIEQQSGGWTLNWQGTGNSNDEFAHAETIYAGLKTALEAIDSRAILSVDGSYTAKPDVAIVVFGEQPYAEFRGDRSDLVYETDGGSDLALLKKLKAADIPVISVFLSGRPLWVNPHINASDAFIAAWLPGTEGGGIADVLIADTQGQARYDFTGKLSFSWPATGEGTPINGNEGEKVAFPFGYGLGYGDSKTLAALSEDPGVNLDSRFTGKLVERGDAAAGLQMYLGDASNANIPVTTLTAESLGGAIKLSGIDYRAQEDSRAIQWQGGGKGEWSVRTSRAIDLSALGNAANLALVIDWKVMQAPKAEATMLWGCGADCARQADIGPLLSTLSPQSWTRSVIPLTCFGDPAGELTRIGLSGDDAMQIAIHAAAIEAAETAECPLP